MSGDSGVLKDLAKAGSRNESSEPRFLKSPATAPRGGGDCGAAFPSCDSGAAGRLAPFPDLL